jgi:hypothetical protein
MLGLSHLFDQLKTCYLVDRTLDRTVLANILEGAGRREFANVVRECAQVNRVCDACDKLGKYLINRDNDTQSVMRYLRALGYPSDDDLMRDYGNYE